MIAVDTNVLVYAHRGESPMHGVALARLKELSEGDDPWAIPLFCVGEFYRLVTHARVFNPPTSPQQARGVIAHVTASPSCRVLLPSDRFMPLFLEICAASDVRGNLAFDAQIAALCREHGATRLLTADRDFMRFTGITVLPLAQSTSSQ